jgi:uncharacterized membrane protein
MAAWILLHRRAAVARLISRDDEIPDVPPCPPRPMSNARGGRMMKYLPFVSAELGAPVRRGTRWQRVALWAVFTWFLLGGLAHFAFTDAVARFLPPQIPDARDIVLLVGIVELAGALGLLLRWTRRLAGWVLLLLTLGTLAPSVWMLHVHDQVALPVWLLWLRLPLLLVLAGLVVWGSRWRPAKRWY